MPLFQPLEFNKTARDLVRTYEKHRYIIYDDLVGEAAGEQHDWISTGDKLRSGNEWREDREEMLKLDKEMVCRCGG